MLSLGFRLASSAKSRVNLSICLVSVSNTSNDFRFRGIDTVAVVVIEKVKACIKFHLPLLFKRFRLVRRQRYYHRQ